MLVKAARGQTGLTSANSDVDTVYIPIRFSFFNHMNLMEEIPIILIFQKKCRAGRGIRGSVVEMIETLERQQCSRKAVVKKFGKMWARSPHFYS